MAGSSFNGNVTKKKKMSCNVNHLNDKKEPCPDKGLAKSLAKSLRKTSEELSCAYFKFFFTPRFAAKVSAFLRNPSTQCPHSAHTVLHSITQYP